MKDRKIKTNFWLPSSFYCPGIAVYYMVTGSNLLLYLISHGKFVYLSSICEQQSPSYWKFMLSYYKEKYTNFLWWEIELERMIHQFSLMGNITSVWQWLLCPVLSHLYANKDNQSKETIQSTLKNLACSRSRFVGECTDDKSFPMLIYTDLAQR